MGNMKIGIFDSGIGGISVLNELQKDFPNEKYIYYADYINNPYGSKTKDELIKIGINIVNILINEGCNIIIIACNTMTISSLEILKELFPNILFVGITPLIKEACNKKYKNILVMGTPFTLKSKYVLDSIKQYKKYNQNIYLLNSPRLAPLVETFNYDNIKEYLINILTDYKDIDCIVLGCTHYSLIKNIIQDIMIDSFILDNTKLISNKLKEFIKPSNINNKEILLLNSKGLNQTYNDVLKQLEQLYKGDING